MVEEERENKDTHVVNYWSWIMSTPRLIYIILSTLSTYMFVKFPQ